MKLIEPILFFTVVAFAIFVAGGVSTLLRLPPWLSSVVGVACLAIAVVLFAAIKTQSETEHAREQKTQD